jgi:HNH endonuclease
VARSPYDGVYARLVANTAEPSNDQGCWEWQAKRDRWWYGRINLYVPGLGRVVTLMAHVALFATFHAAPACADDLFLAYQEVIASGLELDHLCEMPPCCNPDHLELVTPSENCQRRGQRRAANLFARHFTV